MSGAGVGALGGALYLPSRARPEGLPRLMAVACCSFSLGVIALSQSRFLPLSMLLMVFTGFGIVAQLASANTLLQSVVDEDKRRRVMSLHMVSFMGTAPFGSLWGGAAATHIGAPLTLFIGGSLCLLSAAAFIWQMPRMMAILLPLLEHKRRQDAGGTPTDASKVVAGPSTTSPGGCEAAEAGRRLSLGPEKHPPPPHAGMD